MVPRRPRGQRPLALPLRLQCRQAAPVQDGEGEHCLPQGALRAPRPRRQGDPAGGVWRLRRGL